MSEPLSSDLHKESSPPLEKKPELTPDDELFKTIVTELLGRIKKHGHELTHQDLQTALDLAEEELWRRYQQGEQAVSLSESLKSLYGKELNSGLQPQADAMLSLIHDAESAYTKLAEKNKDFLTEALVKEKLYGDIEGLLDNRREQAAVFSLLMIDVDNLKQINDQHGHLAGDAFLRGIAQLFRQAIRAEDRVYRFGGDEFAILAQGNLEGAKVIAEKITTTLQNSRINLENGVQLTPSCSIGVAHSSQLQHEKSANKLIDLADTALYKAKTTRKGTTEVSSV